MPTESHHSTGPGGVGGGGGEAADPATTGATTTDAAQRRRTAALRRLLRHQESLRAVIESISSELELRPLLERILHHACELIGADDGTIGLVDEARNVVRTEAVYNMPPDEMGAEMGPGVGVAGQVLLTRRPVRAKRYGDLPHPTQPSLAENEVIGVPIQWRDRMIGFFGLGRRANGRAARPGGGRRGFSRVDLETLAVYARHAAIAIENARQYRREQNRTERLALIARVGRIVAADLRLDELLQRAADAIHELLGYPNIAIALILPEEPETLVLRTVGGHYRHIVSGEYRIPVSRGLMGAAARSREVVLVNDVHADPRYLQTPGGDGIRCELAVPILLGERVLGVLNVEAADPFTPEDAAGLEIVTDQLAVAIENARLFAAAHRAAALEERHRLARELHDSVTQQLFSLSLMAQAVGPAFERSPAEGARRAERVVELSRAALAEMRALLAELRPAEAPRTPVQHGSGGFGVERVRRAGLVDALRAHAADAVGALPSGATLAVTVEGDGYVTQPAAREEALYRIAQEALNNVVKHARARRAVIRLACGEGGTTLTVRDDGVGIPDRGAGTGGGFGLATMRERAEAVGGTIRVVTAAGRGTAVEVVLPPTGGAAAAAAAERAALAALVAEPASPPAPADGAAGATLPMRAGRREQQRQQGRGRR